MLLAWALVPGALLLAASAWRPLYLSRYVIESAPAIALLAAVGAKALYTRAATSNARQIVAAALALLLAVAVVTSVSTQGVQFRYEDPRAAADYVVDKATAGDGIVYLPVSVRTAVRWYLRMDDVGFPRPDDLLIDPRHSELQQGNFGGRDLPVSAVARQVLSRRSVWVVSYANGSGSDRPAAGAALATLQRCFASSPARYFGLLTVRHFTRLPPAVGLQLGCA